MLIIEIIRERTMKTAYVALLTTIFSISMPVKAEVLEGDEGLACKMILCLSGQNKDVKECDPVISAYYSIKRKKWRKTIRARKNFLKLCPEVEDSKMDNLINALSRGGGQCDANSLNSNLKRCHTRDGDRFCRIDDRLPQYCIDLYHHEYTDMTLPRFENGRWIN